MTEAPPPAELLQAAYLQQIMNEEGPIVKAISISPANEVTEITLDMTPKANKITEVLGGDVTIMGQYTHKLLDGAVVMCLRDQESGELKENTHKLQPPMHNKSVKGPMLLVRMDDNASPKDLLLSDYEEFLKAEIEPFEVEESEEEQSEQNEEDDDGSVDLGDEDTDEEDDEEDEYDEEDDEEELSAENIALLEGVIQNFEQKNGRQPTVEEMEMIMQKLNEVTGAAENDDTDEEDANDEDDSAKDTTSSPNGKRQRN